MEFLLSSRSRIIAQLNREAERSFGVGEFMFSTPVQLDDEGKTSLLITPVSDDVNQGKAIDLKYARRVINDTVNALNYADSDILGFVKDLEVACRVEFEAGCWAVISDDDGDWLIIDDFVVLAKIKLERSANETI